MKAPMHRAIPLLMLVAACNDATGPSSLPEMIPAPPITEELRPDFENACSFGHNSGPECYRLSVQALAAVGAQFWGCVTWPRGAKMCILGAGPSAVALTDWANGRDAFGHRGGEDCNWCTDPPLMHQDEQAGNGNLRGAQ